MTDHEYLQRIDRCGIPSGPDWNARFIKALDNEGLKIVPEWDGVQDERYPWPGTPVCAPIPFGDDAPTWPNGSYIVFKS